jgi:chemotaxis protein methyltransferase CheR
VTDDECVAFLQWALPRLGLRWAGFRRVRRQVCRRIRRRLAALGLDGLAAYRAHLESHPGEWGALDAFCRIPISRFYRDRAVFEALARLVLPELARAARERGAAEIRAWSAGCASGEEPYSLSLAWELGARGRFPALSLRILATDTDPRLLARARRACYPPSSLRELPAGWRSAAFEEAGGLWQLRHGFREGVEFREQDLRDRMPDERFDLVLCRNLAFTYFDPAHQRAALDGLVARLLPGGALAIGSHEALPQHGPELAPWAGASAVFRLRAQRTSP